MLLVKDVINSPADTGKVAGLSRQIIAEMNLLVNNVLFNFEDLNGVVFSTGEPGNRVHPFLQFAAKESLRAALREGDGKKLIINSAYRTVAQQHMLYQLHLQGHIGQAAKPGLSNHEDGLALDIDNYSEWIDILEDHGWKWLGSPRDPWHFSYRGPGGRSDVGDLGVKAFQRLWNRYNPTDQILDDGRFGNQTAQRMNKSPAKGFSAFRLLKLETPPMQGDDVLQVKQALVNIGLLTLDQLDSTYDDATVTAIKKFQADKGLDDDGITGDKTRRALGILS